jgi:hypothetical protein
MKAMSKNIIESDLKSLLSSTAKRQNLLAGLHPSTRAAPLMAMSVADLVKRRTGKDFTNSLLGADHNDVAHIEVPGFSSRGPAEALTGQQPYTKIFESCRNCSASELKRPMNTLTWMVNKVELSS